MFNIWVHVLLALFTQSIIADNVPQSEVPEFVIMVLSYKNENYVKANLDSICYQKSTKPYQIVCVNDCSPDKTGALMEGYVREHNLSSKVKIIHNEKRAGMLKNAYDTIHNHIPDHKIVVVVDGDDVLAHNDVLLRLEQEYRNPDVWLTYGQAIEIPGDKLVSSKMPAKIFTQRKIRKHPFKAVALRTFKAGLFKKIRKEDLLYNGEFIPSSGDVAYMFPMLEMCAPARQKGKNHTVFIPDILYIYNVSNPINDRKVDKSLQNNMRRYVRGLKKYEPLEQL